MSASPCLLGHLFSCTHAQCTMYAFLLWCNSSPLRSGARRKREDLTCQASTIARDAASSSRLRKAPPLTIPSCGSRTTQETLESAKAAWAALPTTRNKLWPRTRTRATIMDACRRGRVSPNQGAAPPLGGPPTGGGDSSRLVVCQAWGRQVPRWDVRRASSSRTAGPRDQRQMRAHTL